MGLEVVILAAGQGTRMRSQRPKVLHRLGAFALVEHVHRLAVALEPSKIAIVYGHGGAQLRAEMAHLSALWIEQAERLGTGHAVQQAIDHLDPNATVLILYGDVPLLSQDTVRRLLSAAEPDCLAVLTVRLDDPKGYGRIVRDEQGAVVGIVEERDCSEAERHIQEVNSGIMALPVRRLKAWLAQLKNQNAQGEYYLTDIIGFAAAEGVPVRALMTLDADEVLGVNDRRQLAHLERSYQARMAQQLMTLGVMLRDPARFDLRGIIPSVGEDVELDVNVVLEGTIEIGHRVRIGPQVVLRDVVIGDDVEILAGSVVEGAILAAGSRIGPMARVRPGSVIGPAAHVGNFVEIKNTQLGAGSKVNHLSYVGDAEVGTSVNLGAGTITCNYDGVHKHRTVIEDDAFIGSATQLVAPVRIGAGATIGAGSTITRDAPAGQLTLSRVRQSSLEHWRRPRKDPERR